MIIIITTLTRTKAATTKPTPSRSSTAYAAFPRHDVLALAGGFGSGGGGGGGGDGGGSRFPSTGAGACALFWSSLRLLPVVLRRRADCHAGYPASGGGMEVSAH